MPFQDKKSVSYKSNRGFDTYSNNFKQIVKHFRAVKIAFELLYNAYCLESNSDKWQSHRHATFFLHLRVYRRLFYGLRIQNTLEETAASWGE